MKLLTNQLIGRHFFKTGMEISKNHPHYEELKERNDMVEASIKVEPKPKQKILQLTQEAKDLSNKKRNPHPKKADTKVEAKKVEVEAVEVDGLAERKAFLKDNDVKSIHLMKDKTVIKKSNELGYEEEIDSITV